jgi:hypothetical protein
MIDAAGWKNPRWEQTTDPILRQIFDSLERWTKNPTVTTISTPQSTTTATYNAATDQVDRPDPVTIFGDQLVAGQLQSSNYAAGSAGWIINSDGTAEFSEVTVRGELILGTAGNGVVFRDSGGTERGEIYMSATSQINVTSLADISVAADGTSGNISFSAGSNGFSANANTDKTLILSSAGNLVQYGSELGAVVGFRGMSSGRCWIQSGSTTITTTGGGAGTVTFPTAFPGTPTSVVCCDGGIGLGVEYITMVFAKSSTNFQFQTRDHAGGFANTVSFKVEWIATYAA